MSRLALPFLAVALFSAGTAFAQEHDSAALGWAGRCGLTWR
jgi:hypothetical protein